jgi:hypothetical protein
MFGIAERNSPTSDSRCKFRTTTFSSFSRCERIRRASCCVAVSDLCLNSIVAMKLNTMPAELFVTSSAKCWFVERNSANFRTPPANGLSSSVVYRRMDVCEKSCVRLTAVCEDIFVFSIQNANCRRIMRSRSPLSIVRTTVDNKSC